MGLGFDCEGLEPGRSFFSVLGDSDLTMTSFTSLRAFSLGEVLVVVVDLIVITETLDPLGVVGLLSFAVEEIVLLPEVPGRLGDEEEESILLVLQKGCGEQLFVFWGEEPEAVSCFSSAGCVLIVGGVVLLDDRRWRLEL